MKGLMSQDAQKKLTEEETRAVQQLQIREIHRLKRARENSEVDILGTTDEKKALRTARFLEKLFEVCIYDGTRSG